MNMVKRIFLILLCITLVAVAARRVPDLYSRWSAGRALEMARIFAKSRDHENVNLSLQASIRARPNNPEAYRFLAELMESEGNPEAVQCRKIVVKLLPKNIPDQLDLARVALRFRRFDVAGETLAGIPHEAQNCPEYLEYQTLLDCARRDLTGAGKMCESLAQRFPDFPKLKNVRLMVARLQIESDDPDDRAKASVTLKKLVDDLDLGPEALRALISAATRVGEFHEALELNKRLMTVPNPAPADRMRNLDLLLLCHSQEAEREILSLKAETRDNPREAAELARCLLERRSSAEALAWIGSLPESLQKKMPVPVVLADCYLSMKNWKALESVVSDGNWGRMEAQRLALLSRIYLERNEGKMASTLWAQARAASQHHAASELFLYHMEMEGGHPEEAHEVLWDISPENPRYVEIQSELFGYYRNQNDANNLLKLLERIVRDHPDDLSAKLDVAQLLLVLDRNPALAVKLAAEVYQADPAPVSHAAVYAYSLCMNGEPAKAAAILDVIGKRKIAGSQCLVYYGLILAACGRNAEARECFKEMDANILFPEMKARVDRWQKQWEKEAETKPGVNPK